MSSLKWPRKEKKKAKQIFFGPHTKPQSNVLTVFHYAPPADIKKLYDAKNIK
jgi:hypothetical protein